MAGDAGFYENLGRGKRNIDMKFVLLPVTVEIQWISYRLVLLIENLKFLVTWSQTIKTSSDMA